MITAVVGLPGSGKTHWIQAQIAQKGEQSSRYFSLDAEAIPIDAIYLQSEFPQLEIFQSGAKTILGKTTATTTFLEIPWYLDLDKIEPLLNQIECDRVALLPSNLDNYPEHTWANRTIVSESFSLTYASQLLVYPPQIHL
jgi:hypothetical protein